MTEKVVKKPLDLSRYQELSIPHDYLAFEIIFHQVDENECENLEYEYLAQGYKLFHSDLTRQNEGKFQLTIIIAKSEVIFNK